MNPSPFSPRVLCWFRRDLRIDDHGALSAALRAGVPVEGVFIFDSDILADLPRHDRRVTFIWQALRELVTQWTASGRTFHLLHGKPDQLIPHLAAERQAHTVFCNHDVEPSAQRRDSQVAASLARDGRRLATFKDQVIFEADEILTREGLPYRVFTPYRRAWEQRFTSVDCASFPVSLSPVVHDSIPPSAVNTMAHWLCHPEGGRFPDLNELGFEAVDLGAWHAGSLAAQQRLDAFAQRMPDYHLRRDYPAQAGSSQLSPHLRFGTLSIRAAVRLARNSDDAGSRAFLGELIWREFFQMILAHRPDLAQGRCFLSRFDALTYPGDEEDFERWCQGQTGYPLVDAAMRQLLATGIMHNRLRMVSASFLTKNLQVDWRWGERHFARHLLDFDFAANNGGWQWCASTGCDAQPWFRIFNPVTQSERFDPDGMFIRHHLPELAFCPDRFIHAPWRMTASSLGLAAYPPPCVDIATSRQATLARYRAISPAAGDIDPA